MKKNLLLIAACAAAMSASAQAQYCFMGEVPAEWDGSATIPAGTVLVENEYAKLSIAFEEPIKGFTPCRDPYNYMAVGGGDLVQITKGITGNNNPKGQTMNSIPASGMVYKLETSKPGYFTVVTKMNTNKNYWLYEGEQAFAAYRLGVCNLSKADGVKVEYTLPTDEYDALNLQAADIATYFNVDEEGNPTGPKVPWAVIAPEGADMGEGTGFMQFLSFATEEYPSTFYFFAQGSKMSCNGFVFTPADEPSFANAPSVTFGGVDKVDADGNPVAAPTPITFGENAGINDIVVDGGVVVYDPNAPVYNIYGQRVSNDTKGLLIQNGVKFFNR